jgi:hypothetical protein
MTPHEEMNELCSAILHYAEGSPFLRRLGTARRAGGKGTSRSEIDVGALLPAWAGSAMPCKVEIYCTSKDGQ